MNANGTITVQDNGFGMDMTATEDGETVTYECCTNIS